METPLISAATAEIICPGHRLTVATANTAQPAAHGKVLLAGQPTPTSEGSNLPPPHSKKGAVPFLITRTQTESVQVIAQLLA